MKLDYQKACTGLPPAFKVVQELSLMREAAVKHRDSIEDATEWPGWLDVPAGELTEMDKARVEVEQIHQATMTTFFEVLRTEISAGNFEIFGAMGFIPFLSAPFLSSGELLDYVSEALLDPATFSALLKMMDPEPTNFTALVVKFGRTFSSEQIDQVWGALKVSLVTHGRDWLLEGDFGDSNIESSSSITWEAYLHATPFMSCPAISKKTLTEVSFLTLASNPAYTGTTAEARYDFGLDALASAAATFNAPLFKKLAEKEKIDPAVISLLLPSWRGTLRSFLIAAKSLSQDAS